MGLSPEYRECSRTSDRKTARPGAGPITHYVNTPREDAYTTRSHAPGDSHSLWPVPSYPGRYWGIDVLCWN